MGYPSTDLAAGLLALQAILAAHIHRLRTGEGQHVDTSLLEAGIALSIWEAAQYFSGGGVPEPMGSAHRMFAPYQAIRCADGYLNLGAANARRGRDSRRPSAGPTSSTGRNMRKRRTASGTGRPWPARSRR